VTATAYTGERLLDWRVTAKGRYFDSQSAGYIFQTLLEEENAEWATGVVVGSTVFTGGTARTLEYHYHDLLKRYQDLCRLTGYDFTIVPVVAASGALTFEAEFYEERGSDLSDSVWLVEGRNLQPPVLDEQGTIANRVILAGEGTTWGADRLDAVAVDVDSREEYGYREYGEEQGTVKESTTLEANAATLLEEKKEPVAVATLRAVDAEPGLFSEYDIGDTVRVQYFLESDEWAQDGNVRVTLREWKPDDVCRLEVE
jgi:hypothetical protein